MIIYILKLHLRHFSILVPKALKTPRSQSPLWECTALSGNCWKIGNENEVEINAASSRRFRQLPDCERLKYTLKTVPKVFDRSEDFLFTQYINQVQSFK